MDILFIYWPSTSICSTVTLSDCCWNHTCLNEYQCVHFCLQVVINLSRGARGKLCKGHYMCFLLHKGFSYIKLRSSSMRTSGSDLVSSPSSESAGSSEVSLLTFLLLWTCRNPGIFFFFFPGLGLEMASGQTAASCFLLSPGRHIATKGAADRRLHCH